MTQTFKVLSLLLSYPTKDVCAGVPELRMALDQNDLLPPKARKGLEAALTMFEQSDIYELQENYVQLFDRTRALSLHLFEHVHGESRDRGQAMVDLKFLYEESGLDMSTGELPDFLPAFLEFLSVCPPADVQDHLCKPLHIISAIKERLGERSPAYAGVFGALEALAEQKPDEDEVNEILKVPMDDPDDLEAMDKEWEETAVEFGPSSDPDSGCTKVSSILERMSMDGSAPNDAALNQQEGRNNG